MKARIAALSVAQISPADAGSTSSDLASKAATTLFAEHEVAPRSVDYLILCTQSPDFALPTTACLVQGRIGMRTDVGAIDVTLGSSGFVYALALAKGLIETDQVRSVLVVTAESQLRRPSDGEAADTGSGDTAAATLLVAEETDGERIGGFVLGAEGEVGADEIIAGIGLAAARTPSDSSTGRRTRAIPDPALNLIAPVVSRASTAAGVSVSAIDHVVLQRVDEGIVAQLKTLGIGAARIAGARTTDHAIGSCALPVALDRLVRSGAVQEGDRIVLAGFATGRSWGAAVVTW